MKIGIVTQPLLNNYGGVLQNYALQTVLLRLGHSPITIDYIPPRKSLWKHLASCVKNAIRCFWGKESSFKMKRDTFERNAFFSDFVKERICKTRVLHEYNLKKIDDDIEAFVVGSDQVWRPRYNGKNIKEMFLDFCKHSGNVKRIAYAASFGVDCWEFSSKLTKKCALLAKKFNAISVREESGVKLCRDYLGVDATWVLDPTLLLNKEDYCELCKGVPERKNVLAAYVLNMTDPIFAWCKKIAKERGLDVVLLGSDSDATMTVSEWLALFRDASYVVTDSFHGTVFSIIFDKEFKCMCNQSRGSARVDSLLKLYDLGKIVDARNESLDWLKKALES